MTNDKELGIALRETLFPDIPPNHTITAKAVGKRLKRHIGEPVSRNGKTLVLKATRDSHDEVLLFFVQTT